MSTLTAPAYVPPLPTDERDIWRISVDRYTQMIASGVITKNDGVELLEGILVPKMSKSPDHALGVILLNENLRAALPAGVHIQIEQPIALDDSLPEPDGAIVLGRPRDRAGRHPTPDEIPIVIEVSDSSLRRDRETKRRVYARNGIAVYWIVNVTDRAVEVYTGPSGPAAAPDDATAATYWPGDAVPVVIGGNAVGALHAADLLP